MKRKSFLFLFLLGALSFSVASCDKDKHDHKFSETWSYNEGYHWHNCTAREGCQEKGNYGEHVASEWIVDTEPTHTEVGSKHKECTTCHYQMGTQVIDATGHTYGDVIYTWSSDYKTCTAKHTCTGSDQYLETEVANSTSRVIRAATCTESELTEYKVTFRLSVFTPQTVTRETHSALGHVEGEWQVTTAATCENVGSKEKHCTRCGIKLSEEVIPALGHDYSAITYTWSNDNLHCTARRTCNRNDKVDEETVEVVVGTKTAATCLTKEVKSYTATFTNSIFEQQYKELEYGEPLGHNESEWIIDSPATCTEDGSKHTECTRCHTTMRTECIEKEGHHFTEITYTWSDDNSKCTAVRTCDKYNSHYEERETVDSTHVTKSAATCTESEVVTYNAVFENSAFVNQSKDVSVGEPLGHLASDWIKDLEPTCAESGHRYKKCTRCNETLEEDVLDPLGHNYSEITYTWVVESPTISCTAKKICLRDNSHSIIEQATITYDIIQEQYCLQAEITRYTATFTNEIFESQHKDIQTKNALEHQESAWKVDTAATCTTSGSRHKECKKCGVTLSTEEISPLGHSYGTVTYEWANDNSSCTASKICGRCNNVESEVKAPTSLKTQEQSCVNAEKVKYTVAFEKEGFESKSKEVQTKAPLGHSMSAWTIVKDPTCTTSGTRRQTCSRCGETGEEDISALGHEYLISYSYSTDYTTCTATRHCARTGCEHVAAEQSSTGVWTKLTDLSCSSDETYKIVYEFTSPFETQTVDQYVSAKSTGQHNFEGDGICECGKGLVSIEYVDTTKDKNPNITLGDYGTISDALADFKSKEELDVELNYVLRLNGDIEGEGFTWDGSLNLKFDFAKEYDDDNVVANYKYTVTGDIPISFKSYLLLENCDFECGSDATFDNLFELSNGAEVEFYNCNVTNNNESLNSLINVTEGTLSLENSYVDSGNDSTFTISVYVDTFEGGYNEAYVYLRDDTEVNGNIYCEESQDVADYLEDGEPSSNAITIEISENTTFNEGFQIELGEVLTGDYIDNLVIDNQNTELDDETLLKFYVG